MMKHRIFRILMVACLLSCLCCTVFAETTSGKTDWAVTLTADKKLESNFTKEQLLADVAILEPGDTATFTVNLKNRYSEAVDWYMLNDVIKTFEETGVLAANGDGIYSYTLTYTDPNGKDKVLYDSNTVGGSEDPYGEGLHSAVETLKDYFKLDNIAAGKDGRITLTVGVEGETHGNEYQDTLAEVIMKFAVEIKDEKEPEKPPVVVKTGDSSDVIRYLIIAGVSGLLFLILAIYSLKTRKKEKTARESAS